MNAYAIQGEVNELVFIAPQDSIAQMDEKGVVRISFKDSRCLITIKINARDAVEREPTMEQLQKQVQDQYPGSEIPQPMVCYSGIGSGYYFDVERATAYQSKLTTRTAFITVQGAQVELSLAAASPKFAAEQIIFRGFLGSLQMEKRVALEQR
ncbi:MAG: hypothetical protein JWR19_605 [Pedosphaera sp.]|nr:hypothetical protein [Pedosphaera sp.]